MVAKKKQVLTYDELMAGFNEKLAAVNNKEKAWAEHISVVKELTLNVKMNRMVIAEIAYRACLIYWGGDVKSEEFKKHHQPNTLKSFSKRCGIHYNTLSAWVLVRTRVFDKLPQSYRDDFKFTAGDKTSKTLYSTFRKTKNEPTPEEVIETYEHNAVKPEGRARSERITKYLRQAYFYIVKRDGLIGLEVSDIEEYRLWAREILVKINEYEKILKLKPVVITRRANK